MHHDDRTRRRVALGVSPRYVSILRREFEIARDGRLDDLARHPTGLTDPARTRRQADLYDQLLRQLDIADSLTGDRDALLAVLTEIGTSNDRGNEYERVVAEHEAFAHLIAQLDREAGTDAA